MKFTLGSGSAQGLHTTQILLKSSKEGLRGFKVWVGHVQAPLSRDEFHHVKELSKFSMIVDVAGTHKTAWRFIKYHFLIWP